MFSEENIINTLIGGAIVAGFIGAWIGCVRFTERGEIENKKNRKEARRGVTNYARRQALMAVGNGVIKKG